jgi:hypothetical protein
MGAFPNDRSNDPKAAIDYGRDFNFFQKLTVTSTTFNADADMVILFPSYTVTFQLESGSGSPALQYSFNGNTIHGDMTAPSGGLIFSSNLVFENRQICKIWWRAPGGGSPVVRVEAWATR